MDAMPCDTLFTLRPGASSLLALHHRGLKLHENERWLWKVVVVHEMVDQASETGLESLVVDLVEVSLIPSLKIVVVLFLHKVVLL